MSEKSGGWLEALAKPRCREIDGRERKRGGRDYGQYFRWNNGPVVVTRAGMLRQLMTFPGAQDIPTMS